VTDPAPSPTTDRHLPGRGTPHRVIWRWHFYAGVIVTPFLLVVAVTGALYVFKNELERWMNAGVTYVTPGDAAVSYESQVRSAPASLEISSDPARATVVVLQAPKQPGRRVGVDPHTGKALGQLTTGTFFPTVLELHRHLFLGTTGRVIVELTTCWTIALLATGLYLWWPRRREAVRGVWLPRLTAKRYVVLRDLHALAGLYLLPVIATAVCTGLIYTLVWGYGYRYGGQKTGAFTTFTAFPKSPAVPGAKALSIDDAVAVARAHYSGHPLSLFLPRRPNDSYVFFVRGDAGPVTQGVLVLNRFDGSVLSDKPASQFPNFAWLGSWNYALHVGSVLGTPTKILWLVAMLVLAGLPVTGLWMWWQRRPRGRTGLPRRLDVRVSRWVTAGVVGLAVLLPVFGASVVLILAAEWVVRTLRRKYAGAGVARGVRPGPQMVTAEPSVATERVGE
jgi:uncharacterized iron-regulated membrane protein